jgi:cytoskeleton protein RodZ
VSLASPPVEAGPGKRLSGARQAKNLTVANVSQQLHLDPRLVTALENNDYDHLPEPIYVSGYLRNYARLLGLSEEEIVGAYQQLDRPAPPILSELTRNAPRRPAANQSLIQWATVAVVIIGLMVFGWHMNGKQATPSTAPGGVAEVAPASVKPTPQPAAAAPGISKDEPRPPAAKAGPDRGREVATPSAAQAAAQPSTPAVANADAAEAPASQTATLAFHFADDSWVEVTDATGERVFFDLGEAGQTRTVQGSPPFKILLGYSPGVSIEYNGVAFDQSRFTSHNNVARFTIGR